MSSLPAVSGRDVIRALGKAGFGVDRISGSHHVLKREGHPFVITVPVHGNRSLGRGLLLALIRDSGLTRDEFLELLSD